MFAKDAIHRIGCPEKLEIEGWMEEKMGDVGGEFQGAAIDVVTPDEVKIWKEKMSKVLGNG